MTKTLERGALLRSERACEFRGARLCAKNQPQRVDNAAAGPRHSRAPEKVRLRPSTLDLRSSPCSLPHVAPTAQIAAQARQEMLFDRQHQMVNARGLEFVRHQFLIQPAVSAGGNKGAAGLGFLGAKH